ncbi:MAG TPA: methyl-accepting chemotaxis protein [Candidatus Elarobacter sp.]
MRAIEPPALLELRSRASQVFTVILWLHVPVVAAVAAANHHAPLAVSAVAALLALIGTIGARLSPGGLGGRLSVAYALVGMPMLLVHAGSGVWQIDYHMYFFAVFAMLAAYVDWRPIALAAALTALHHLVLDFVLPAAVFPQQSGLEGLPRVILHALIVVAECGILFWMTARVRGLFIAAEAQNQRANDALIESQRLRDMLAAEGDAKTSALTDTRRALDEAQRAAVAAKREEALRIQSERETALQREAIVRDIVSRLDESVRSVVEEVLGASQRMLDSARDAERLAENTREEVDRVAGITAESSSQIGEVAIAAGQLSRSSADILSRMQHALDVAQRAVRESARGGDLARSLTDAAERIDAVTTLIENVADQTRLLSLNAAIEAARAGDSGRGFAVVAEEVRKLAEATSSATGEIADVVTAMRRASKDVAGALGEIGTSVGELTSAATEVASAVEEQSSATDMIAATVRTVASGTDEIRGAIERVAGASMRVGASAAQVLMGADAVVAHNHTLRENVSAVTRELLSSESQALTAVTA